MAGSSLYLCQTLNNDGVRHHEQVLTQRLAGSQRLSWPDWSSTGEQRSGALRLSLSSVAITRPLAANWNLAWVILPFLKLFLVYFTLQRSTRKGNLGSKSPTKLRDPGPRRSLPYLVNSFQSHCCASASVRENVRLKWRLKSLFVGNTTT